MEDSNERVKFHQIAEFTCHICSKQNCQSRHLDPDEDKYETIRYLDKESKYQSPHWVCKACSEWLENLITARRERFNKP